MHSSIPSVYWQESGKENWNRKRSVPELGNTYFVVIAEGVEYCVYLCAMMATTAGVRLVLWLYCTQKEMEEEEKRDTKYKSEQKRRPLFEI